jgi:hypothetical protein
MTRRTLMKPTSKYTMTDEEIYAEMEKRRQEFMSQVDVRILDATDDCSSFSAIIDSRGPIVIE